MLTGQFVFECVATEFSGDDIDWFISDSSFFIIVRNGTETIKTSPVSGRNPSWDKEFVIPFTTGQDQTVKIGLMASYRDPAGPNANPTDRAIGLFKYCPDDDILANNSNKFTTKLTILGDVQAGGKSAAVTATLTISGSFTPDGATEHTSLTVANQPSSPSAPIEQDLYLPSTPQPFVEHPQIPLSTPSGHTTPPALTSFNLKSQGFSLSKAAGNSQQFDLHYPLAPSDYLGQRRMLHRALPDGSSSSNPEKGTENDEATLPSIEFAINSLLKSTQITLLNNADQLPNLWKPQDRYRGTEFDQDWFVRHPAAWAGSMNAINLYFSPHTDQGSVLIGIEQEWTNVPLPDGTKGTTVSYGLTPSKLDQMHPGTSFPAWAQKQTFRVPADDFISYVDVTSGCNGITSMRFITANGVDSGTLCTPADHFGRRMSPEQLYHEHWKTDSRYFLHQSVLLDKTGSFSALAYFCSYERPVLDSGLKAFLNTGVGIGSNAPCPVNSSIGGLRICSSHPIHTKELTKEHWSQQKSLEGPSSAVLIAAPVATQAQNADNNLTPLEIEEVRDYQINTAANTNIPGMASNTDATYVNSAANYSSTSTPYSASSSAKVQMRRENRVEFSGWGFPIIVNFITLLILGIVMAIYTEGVYSRSRGPTTCQMFDTKINMLWIPPALNFLYCLFFICFCIAWWALVVCPTHEVKESRPLVIYNITVFVFAILSAVFNSVAMAWVFKVPLGCITYSERFTLFSMYVVMLSAFPGFMLALIFTQNNHYLWYHAIPFAMMINILAISGFVGAMIPCCDKTRDGCLCCESDHP